MYILLRRFTHLNTFFLHDPIWVWQSNVRQSKTLTNFRYSSLIIVVALEEAQVASLQKVFRNCPIKNVDNQNYQVKFSYHV